MKARLVTSGVVIAVCVAAGIGTHSLKMTTVAAAQQATAAFNSSEARPKEDPTKVAHGKALYAVNCEVCHGVDLRGGDMGGPNLLRSQATLTDRHGETIVPIIQGALVAQGMPKIDINLDESNAVAAYVRSVISTIGEQGTPPGEQKVLNIVVGDAARGRTYVATHCQKCHAVDGDLKEFAARVPDAKTLQTTWVAGGRASAFESAGGKVTAEVTVAPGQIVMGRVIQIDDFLITLKLDDGTSRSFRRDGMVPKVVVHDSLQAHRAMLPLYTDQDIHDVTAYLVTLK